MKTAVSLPDPIFEAAERLARRLGKSRSQLYAQAVSEYLQRRDADAITAAMDAVCDEIDTRLEPDLAAAAARTLEAAEW